jgi:hypothetical protein
MYVRWQRYEPKVPRHWGRKPLLKAVLVESVRIDGKPRQKHVAFLASIPIEDNETFPLTNPGFWYRATKRLNGLGDRLSRQDRAHISAALAEKVEGQLLTAAQLRRFEREAERRLSRLFAGFVGT